MRRIAAAEAWQGLGSSSRLVRVDRSTPATTPARSGRFLTERGFRRIRLHDLRHTAASLMLAEEVPARVVMEVLGHAQMSLTMNTYSHVADESLLSVAQRMEATLWKTNE
jgi:integrase